VLDGVRQIPGKVARETILTQQWRAGGPPPSVPAAFVCVGGALQVQSEEKHEESNRSLC